MGPTPFAVYVFAVPPAPASATPAPAACGANMLRDGMAYLADQMVAHFSDPIVYARGSDQAALCAQVGKQLLKLADELGAVRMEWTDADFVIRAADLVLAGNRVLPRRGDKITYNDGSKVHAFEVLPIGTEPPWRWSDPFHKMIRIHSKRITSEPV